MTAVSIELRVATEGDCTCGTPKPVGSPPSNCRHVIVTKWGRISTPRPLFWPNNPEVEPLMLASREWVDGMAQTGETRELCGARERIRQAFGDGGYVYACPNCPHPAD